MFGKHSAVGRHVLVALFSGNALEGVCTYDGRHYMILRAAVVHEPGTEATPSADGEIRIDKANVDYVQFAQT